MQLLERDDVLASLTEYAEAARGGDARLVLIAGEAGVGKTTLLDAFRSRCSGDRWVWGACDGAFTPRPLGPLFDIAAQLGGDLQRACRDAAPRERIFRALLDAISASDPATVLVVEDVHWADEATLDLLRFLVPRLRAAKVLLLVTYRDDALAPDHPLRVTLGELATARVTRRITLPPLSRQAVSALARGTRIGASELYDMTAGNPFFIAELVEAGPGELPQSAREAVLARVARLSGDARRALEAAALIGARVEVDVLRDVVSSDADAIDECLTAGLLVSDPPVFRFRHEIARRAVEDALPLHRRRDLHQRALDVLVQAGTDDDARLAHHADGAGDGAAVLAYAPRAARRAAELAAHREAAAQFQRAVRFSSRLAPADRAVLFEGLATESAMIDRWEQAAEARQAALQLWRETGDQLRVGDSLRLLSRTMWRLCRGPESEAAAQESVAILEQLPPSSELAWTYSSIAARDMYRNSSAAVERARTVQALAEQQGDTALLSEALNTEGCAAINLGRDGLPQLVRALGTALSAGHEEQAGRAYANLTAVLASSVRLVEAQRWAVEGLAYCDEHDMGTYGNCLRGAQLEMFERQGRWDDAEAMCAVELERRHLSPGNRVGPLVTRALVRARREQPEAGAPLEDAWRMTSQGGEAAAVLPLRIARAEVAWLTGDVQGMRQELLAAAPLLQHHDPWTRGALHTWARRCALDLGAAAEVAPPYERMLAGDWRAAAELWTELGCPYDAGLALLDSGNEQGLREAVAVLERLGAVAAVAIAQTAMRQLGLRAIPRGRRAETRANPWGLTRREWQVLGLVCDGMSNADIADRLVLAQKTVDHHVSAVLAKLEVSSRRSAARKATEAGHVQATAI
jgi:DNA-binding CsgD family transcriptional regulator